MSLVRDQTLRIVRDGGEVVCLKCGVPCDFEPANAQTLDEPGNAACWGCPECGISRDDSDLYHTEDDE